MMSVLVSLEGQLGTQRSENIEPCNDIIKRTPQEEAQLLTLLHVVFHTISTAMRFEPANAKFFHHEVNINKSYIIICTLSVANICIIYFIYRYVNQVCVILYDCLDVSQHRQNLLK